MSLQADAFRALEQQMSALPSDKRGALIASITPEGVVFGVAAKLGDHWKIAADFERTFASGDQSGQVLVAASW